MKKIENIIDENGFTPTESTKKLRVKGEVSNFLVYKIPIGYLYYNYQNGRIATEISKYEHEYGKIKEFGTEDYNSILETAIINSDKPSYEKTKKNIEVFGQNEPGVIFPDGRVIDGNRRYTCLRKLFEETGDQKFAYFEAVILDSALDEKEIKLIELELQHGREEKVDYKPIDKLVDIYRDVVKSKMIDVKEYAASIDVKVSEVEKRVELAELMVDFLEYINAEEQFYIARDLEIDGPLNEILRVKRKLKDNEDKWEKVRITLFDNIVLKAEGDITRSIRSIINDIVPNDDKFDDFFEEHEKQSILLNEEIAKEDSIDVEFIRKNIRENLSEVRDAVKRNNDKVLHSVKIDKVKNQPLDILQSINNDINKLDLQTVRLLNVDSKEIFKRELNELKDRIVEIEGIVNES